MGRKSWFHEDNDEILDPAGLINDYYDEENISVYDAAEIWASNGKDEDYTFGYTEEELEEALG